jgi:Cys-rich repeat protein
MSRVGRTQSPSQEGSSEGSDGKIFGLERNTAIIIGIVVLALILILAYYYLRTPAAKSTDPKVHHIPNTKCLTDAECPTGKLCNAATGICVECYEDAQCAESEVGIVCDQSTSKCVECNADTDCLEGQQCIGHVCSPAV